MYYQLIINYKEGHEYWNKNGDLQGPYTRVSRDVGKLVEKAYEVYVCGYAIWSKVIDENYRLIACYGDDVENYINESLKGGDTMSNPIPPLAEDLPRLVYCKHGLIECCCGMCTKHPHSVIVKGGPVKGSTSRGPAHIANPWAGKRYDNVYHYDY